MKPEFDAGNIPTYRVAWNHPIRIQKPPQVAKLPVYNFFSERCQPPIFHFRLRQEIVHELRQQQDRLQDFGDSPLFPVDVVFNQAGFEGVKKYYYPRYEIPGKLLRELGRWLTEQVTAAFLDQVDKKSNWPDIFVRCTCEPENETTNEQNRKWFDPYCRIGNWIASRIPPSIDIPKQPPFRLIFPKRNDHNASIPLKFKDLVTPNRPYLSWFDKGLQSHEMRSIPFRKPDRKKYPLVDREQVKLSLVIFPWDGQSLVYAQHVGRHESWVYNGPSDENTTEMDGWVNIPRDGWMPIYPDNILVLGRMAKTANGVRIVPGSMVLNIEYSQG